jgi:hypothetical protein
MTEYPLLSYLGQAFFHQDYDLDAPREPSAAKSQARVLRRSGAGGARTHDRRIMRPGRPPPAKPSPADAGHGTEPIALRRASAQVTSVSALTSRCGGRHSHLQVPACWPRTCEHGAPTRSAQPRRCECHLRITPSVRCPLTLAERRLEAMGSRHAPKEHDERSAGQLTRRSHQMPGLRAAGATHRHSEGRIA